MYVVRACFRFDYLYPFLFVQLPQYLPYISFDLSIY